MNEAPPLRKTQGSLPPPRLAMPVGHLGRPSTPVWAPGEESPEGPHWQRPGGGAGAARGRGKARLTAGAGRLWADFSSGGAREGSCGAGPPWGWGWTGPTGWGPGNSRLGEMTLLGEAETGQTGSEMQVGSRLCGCPDPETGHRAMLC